MYPTNYYRYHSQVFMEPRRHLVVSKTSVDEPVSSPVSSYHLTILKDNKHLMKSNEYT